MTTSNGLQINELLRIDGMQRGMHPILAKFSEPELMINMWGPKRLAKQVRSGYRQYLDRVDTSPVYRHIGITINHTLGNKSYIFRFSGKNCYYRDLSVSISTWTLLFSFTNDPGGINYTKFQNALFVFSDAGNNPMRIIRRNVSTGNLEFFDETATGAPTNPKYGEVALNALFTINDSAAGYRLRRSEIGYGSGSPSVPFDGTQWTENDNDVSTARMYEVDASRNGFGVGLYSVNGRLTIWMASDVGDAGMYFYSLQDGIARIPTSTSIRPGGAATIADVDGVTHFANSDGIYQHGGGKPQRISLALGEDIITGWNPKCATSFKDRYYILALASTITLDPNTTNQRTLQNPIIVFDKIANEVYLWNTASRMTALTEIASSATSANQIYSGDDQGYSYIWDSSKDDAGKAISAEIEFRPYYGPVTMLDKNFEELYAVTDVPGAFHVQVRRVESEKWTDDQELDKDFTRVVLPQGVSYTKGVKMRVTTTTTGDRPSFLGWAPVFNRETSG